MNEGEELTEEQAAKLGAKVIGVTIVTLFLGTLLWFIRHEQKKSDAINQEIKELDAVINFYHHLRAESKESSTNLNSKPNPMETDIIK